MKMQWWQLGFLVAAGYMIWRIFAPPKVDSGIEVTPAAAAGATQGSSGSDTVPDEAAASSMSPGTIVGVANPTPDLGYNFSRLKNNTFSTPGNATSPTFLPDSSDANGPLTPIIKVYLENLGNTGWVQ